MENLVPNNRFVNTENKNKNQTNKQTKKEFKGSVTKTLKFKGKTKRIENFLKPKTIKRQVGEESGGGHCHIFYWLRIFKKKGH